MVKSVSIDCVKICNRSHDGKWFSPENMRFFASRVSGVCYLNEKGDKAFFVSSEACRWNRERRKYSVRVCNLENGSIDTHGDFQMYNTRAQAHAAAKKAALVF